MTKKKAIVIIDGSNFYYKLKELELLHKSLFDYHSFTKHICKSYTVVHKYYCIGKIKAKQEDTKAREMMAKQQSLVTRLQKDGFVIQYGFLLKTDHHFKEKGVDIQMAVDLMPSACCQRSSGNRKNSGLRRICAPIKFCIVEKLS